MFQKNDSKNKFFIKHQTTSTHELWISTSEAQRRRLALQNISFSTWVYCLSNQSTTFRYTSMLLWLACSGLALFMAHTVNCRWSGARVCDLNCECRIALKKLCRWFLCFMILWVSALVTVPLLWSPDVVIVFPHLNFPCKVRRINEFENFENQLTSPSNVHRSINWDMIDVTSIYH